MARSSNCMSVNVAEWLCDARLRLCTHHERGVWFEVMCLMHRSEEYGLIRQNLQTIAQAVGSDQATLESLIRKGVMKGQAAGDSNLSVEQASNHLPFVYSASHAGQRGPEVTLIEKSDGDVWFSDRMVIAEYKRVGARRLARASGRTVRASGKRKLASGAREDEGSETARDERPGIPDCPYAELADLFAQRFPDAPRPRSLSSTTVLGKSMRSQWRKAAAAAPTEFTGYRTLEDGLTKWGNLFDEARKSRFLRGEVPGKDGQGSFRISMDWLMRPGHLEKVVNGFYDRDGGGRSIAGEVKASAESVARAVSARAARSASDGVQVSIFGQP